MFPIFVHFLPEEQFSEFLLMWTKDKQISYIYSKVCIPCCPNLLRKEKKISYDIRKQWPFLQLTDASLVHCWQQDVEKTVGKTQFVQIFYSIFTVSVPLMRPDTHRVTLSLFRDGKKQFVYVWTCPELILYIV